MKKYFSALAGLVLVLVCYPFAKLPRASDSELRGIASQFKFTQTPLPEILSPPVHKNVRKVHPSLERIAAWVSSLGAAVTLCDLDGDNLPNDVIHVDPRTDLVTVAPVPGTGHRYKPFSLNSTAWANNNFDTNALAPMGSLAGDFNEDGSIDIMVYFWGRTPLLYFGQKLTSQTESLSLSSFTTGELVPEKELWYSNSALQSDLDGDGHMDLLIGNYYPDGSQVLDAKASGIQKLHEGKSKALNGGLKHIFLWQGKSTNSLSFYKESKDVFSPIVSRGWTLAMGAVDLDGDLLPELYLANDFGPDSLLHNRSIPGKLAFTPLQSVRDLRTPKSCVIGQDSFKSMGVDFADLNGDGVLDIFVSNLATRFGLTESHFLWLSKGDTAPMKNGLAPYSHGSEKLGLSRSGFAFEARFADFNNDGSPEAMQACGFIKGKINRWPELQALGTSNDQIVHNPRFWPTFRVGADLSGGDCNAFFSRGTDGTYHNIAALVGMEKPMVGRGIATADVDADGRIDFVAANQWAASYFFKNEAPKTGASLGLRLRLPSGAPAIGASANLTLPNGKKLIGQISNGTGHSGHSSCDLHFGLGNLQSNELCAVTLQWRDESGKPRQRSLQLTPGWHSVHLSASENLAFLPSIK